jgi:hypothetical protein
VVNARRRSALKTTGPGIAMRGAKITLLHLADGSSRLRYKEAER